MIILFIRSNRLININILNYFIRHFSILIVLVFSSIFCVFNANSQCTNFLIEETDTIYEFEFIQESILNPLGVNFTSYIEANLPLCGVSSLNGAGCFQLQLMNPSISGADYTYADIGFSTATFNIFTEDQWFSDVDNDGCLLSEDCDGDGLVIDAFDAITGLDNPYDIPVLGGTESTFYFVISFYCADG